MVGCWRHLGRLLPLAARHLSDMALAASRQRHDFESCQEKLVAALLDVHVDLRGGWVGGARGGGGRWWVLVVVSVAVIVMMMHHVMRPVDAQQLSC